MYCCWGKIKDDGTLVKITMSPIFAAQRSEVWLFKSLSVRLYICVSRESRLTGVLK